MDPSLAQAGWWLLFGATHIGFASSPVRDRVVSRIGEAGFQAVFSLVAAVMFSLAVNDYAVHRGEGAAAFGLGGSPLYFWPLVGLIAFGMMLIAGSLATYPRSPMALSSQSVRPARGIDRITRHGFFAGVAAMGFAHALLAPLWIGVVFWTGIALVAIVGARHQDTKLRRQRGPEYTEYIRQTSFVPFAAILAGRQKLMVRELPFVALGIGLALTFALREIHASIFADGGAWVIGATLLGAALATVSARRANRARPPQGQEARGAKHAA